MSYGLVICSQCKREVHQTGPRDQHGKYGWQHCEDKTARCEAAESVYPAAKSDIRGQYCGHDGMEGFI
jgi:hypothetical protein